MNVWKIWIIWIEEQVEEQTRSNMKYETEQIDIRNELEINRQLVLIFYEIRSQKEFACVLFIDLQNRITTTGAWRGLVKSVKV